MGGGGGLSGNGEKDTGGGDRAAFLGERKG